jgi:hypothetical protein
MRSAGERLGDAVVRHERRELRALFRAAQHHAALGRLQALVRLQQDARTRAVQLAHAAHVEDHVAHAVGDGGIDAVVQELRRGEEERPFQLERQDLLPARGEQRLVRRIPCAPRVHGVGVTLAADHAAAHSQHEDHHRHRDAEQHRHHDLAGQRHRGDHADHHEVEGDAAPVHRLAVHHALEQVERPAVEELVARVEDERRDHHARQEADHRGDERDEQEEERAVREQRQRVGGAAADRRGRRWRG